MYRKSIKNCTTTIFKNVSKRRNYQIMLLIPILILILGNSELQHAVDHSENSGSRIADQR
jgi:hypothetical protein